MTFYFFIKQMEGKFEDNKPRLTIELSQFFEVMPEADTQTIHVEQSQKISQPHFDLNAVDKYVVDNYERFVKGICLEQIHIEGYKSTGIAKKLNAICNVERITAKQYKQEYGEEFVPTAKRIRVYTLKPKGEIPDFYKVLEEYYNKTFEEELEPDVPQEEVHDNMSEKEEQDDLATTIIKNKELFKLGIKRSWLKKLGISADFPKERSKSPINTKFEYCMSLSTGADLSFEGKKLVGSAQFRKEGAILQHGSILFNYEPEKISQIFGEEPRKDTITVLDEISPGITPERLCCGLKAGFEEKFGLEFVHSEDLF